MWSVRQLRLFPRPSARCPCGTASLILRIQFNATATPNASEGTKPRLRSLEKMPNTGVLGVGKRLLARGAQLPDGFREMLAVCLIFGGAITFFCLIPVGWLPDTTSGAIEAQQDPSNQKHYSEYTMVPVYDEKNPKEIKYYRQVPKYELVKKAPSVQSPY